MRREQHQHAQQLQPAQQHGHAAHPGLEIGQPLVIAGRPHLAQAGGRDPAALEAALAAAREELLAALSA